MAVAQFRTTKPHQLAVRTRAGRSARVAVRLAADARAANREAAVAFVRALREKHPETSTHAAHGALVKAIATRAAPFFDRFDDPKFAPFLCAPKDPSTLYRWVRSAERAEAAGTSVTDALADAPGRGRTRILLPDATRAEIQRLAGVKRHTVRGLVAAVQGWAETHGYANGDEGWPTSHKVRRAMDDLGQTFHTAAAQGSQAARLDAVVHAAVPTDHPHQVWTGDTFKCPIPVRGFDEEAFARGEDPYVAHPAEVVIFVENHSDVVVSHYVTDPRGRRRVDAEGVRLDERDDAEATGAVTAVEALGAFLSAALPDLAPLGTRDVAGRLPSKSLRLDVAMQQMLRGPLSAFPGLVADLPGNYPPARGEVEKILGGIKDQLAAVPGAAPVYVVPKQTAAADARDRVRQAPKDVRYRPTIHIAPRDLPDIAHVRAIVDAAVHQYNHAPGRVTPDNPRGWSPAQRLAADLRDTHGRPGTDALRLMDIGDVLVSKGGVVYRSAVFADSPTLGVAPADGSPVVEWGVRQVMEFRADPLFRGLFAYPKGAAVGETRTVFLRRLSDAARAADPGRVGRAQRDKAAAASKAAREARDATARLEIGLEGMHHAAQEGAAAQLAAGWGRKGRQNGSGKRGKSARTGTKSGAPRGAAPKGRSPDAGTPKADGKTAHKASPKAARPKSPIKPAADRIDQHSFDLPPGVAPPPPSAPVPAVSPHAPVVCPPVPAPAVHRPWPAPVTTSEEGVRQAAPPIAPPQSAPPPAAPVEADPPARRSPAFAPPLRWGLASDPRTRVRRLTGAPPPQGAD